MLNAYHQTQAGSTRLLLEAVAWRSRGGGRAGRAKFRDVVRADPHLNAYHKIVMSAVSGAQFERLLLCMSSALRFALSPHRFLISCCRICGGKNPQDHVNVGF